MEPYTFQLGPFALSIRHSPSTSLAARFDRMDSLMSELSSAVDTLKTAVDGVAQRLLPQIDALEDALAAAILDDADADAVFADALAATAAIRVEADRLNGMGANPDTPIEPAPETTDETGPEATANGSL